MESSIRLLNSNWQKWPWTQNWVGWCATSSLDRNNISKCVTFRSAAMIDNGSLSSYHSSLAKTFAAEKANKAAANAVEVWSRNYQVIIRETSQIFGHAGCSEGVCVEKLMRDAKIFQIYGGTTQVGLILRNDNQCTFSDPEVDHFSFTSSLIGRPVWNTCSFLVPSSCFECLIYESNILYSSCR